MLKIQVEVDKPIIFIQDGCSVHRAYIVKDWLIKHKVDVLEWVAKSPDFNPIENMWAIMKRQLQDLPNLNLPKNSDELWAGRYAKNLERNST